MRLLVTGGAGFIGSNFIRYWLKKYPTDSIVNLDKLTYASNIAATEDFKDSPNYQFIHGDICDITLVDKVMAKVNTVVHFAAETHVDRAIENPRIFLETNVIGTHTLLESAKKYGVGRFHHISTDEVFGELSLESKEKFNEESRHNPRSPYAASKSASDELALSYYCTYNLPVTITNSSNNYGPYQSPEKFIPRAITDLLDSKPIKLYGDGKYVRDWIYVEDHIEAIDLVIKRGKVGEAYVVGGQTDEISNREVAEMLLEILGKPKKLITYVNDRPGHDRKYAVDWTKIKRGLGWKPKSDFRNWLEKTAKWYSNNRPYWEAQKVKTEEFYAKINR